MIIGLVLTVVAGGFDETIAQIPVGPEFQVNTYTASGQWSPAAASDADGDVVITWHSMGQDGSELGVFAQRYDRTGTPAGGEFRVNTDTASYQMSPAVASDADGDFVITWQSDQDGSDFGIFAQRYDATGTPVGTEFQVNTYATSVQQLPAVASDADGDFVITWTSFAQDGDSSGVFAQRDDATGTPVRSLWNRVNCKLVIGVLPQILTGVGPLGPRSLQELLVEMSRARRTGPQSPAECLA